MQQLTNRLHLGRSAVKSSEHEAATARCVSETQAHPKPRDCPRPSSICENAPEKHSPLSTPRRVVLKTWLAYKYFNTIQQGARSASLNCSGTDKSDQELSCFITLCTFYCSFHNEDLHSYHAAAAGFVEGRLYCGENTCSTLITKICLLAFYTSLFILQVQMLSILKYLFSFIHLSCFVLFFLSIVFKIHLKTL